MGLRREQQGVQLVRFPFASLAGRVLVHALFYTAASLFIVLVVTPSFGWGLKSASSVLVVFGAFGLTMLPLSMIAASLVRNRFTAFQVLMFVSTPLFLVSGFTWPLDQMPPWLQSFASAFPATPALLALRVLAVKTPDLTAVSHEVRWLAILFGVYTTLAIVVVHAVAWWHRRHAARNQVTPDDPDASGEEFPQPSEDEARPCSRAELTPDVGPVEPASASPAEPASA